ncbi:MAG: hypothetical protein K0Q51_20 [Rickettsiaceae bacterium]|nr:hypothetical protein [Rickettsiaceae bacterium]
MTKNELEILASKTSMFSLSVPRPKKTQKQTLDQINAHKNEKKDVRKDIEQKIELFQKGKLIGTGWEEVLEDYLKSVDTWKKKFYTPLDELLTLQDKLKYIDGYTFTLLKSNAFSQNNISLEKAHDFYSNICELEKSASSQLTRQQKEDLRKGKLAAESYCKQFTKNEILGKESELTELIELIDKKDPKLVARQMYEALKETSNGTQKNAQSADAIPEISSEMYETILQHCSPEQTMKLAKINQEVEKLKGNQGKSSFIENLKLFCKKAASIALSKYKVKDVDLKKAFDQLEQVAYDPEKYKPIKTTSSYETKTKKNLTSFVSKVNASRSKGQGQGQSNGIG